ncbi:MAG: DUF4860 domain-containing protein [Lachnospiraceae bacterium]
MQFSQKQYTSFHTVFLLLLFCLFAVLSLCVTLLGASAYKQTTDHLNNNYDAQQISTFFTEQIRQVDCQSPIFIYQKDDTCVLVIVDYNSTTPHYTYFYQYAGSLSKLTLPSYESFSLSDGKKIFPASDFSAEACSDQLYKFTIWDTQDKAHEFFIHTQTTVQK